MEKERIKDIAENLDFGMRCFVHLKTKEIKFIPDYDKHPDMDQDIWVTNSEEIDKNFADYIEIMGMESRESFRVMVNFVAAVDDEKIKDKLIEALDRPKPFRNFKFAIDNSGEYRDKWFRFKDEKLMDWVHEQLQENRLC